MQPHPACPPPSDPGPSRVLAYATVVRTGQEGALPALAQWVAAERAALAGSAEIEWLLIDLTQGGLEQQGAVCVRHPARNGPQGLERAALGSRASHFAWLPPDSGPLPGRTRATLDAIERAPRAALLLGPLEIERAGPGACYQVRPEHFHSLPPAGFEQGLALSRAALLGLDLALGVPIELQAWRRHRAELELLERPVCRLQAERLPELGARLLADQALLEAWSAEAPAGLAMTVLLATHQRLPVLLECLEGFARQSLPRGRFEVLVIDDGSRDGTAEALAALRLPVPFTGLSVPPGGAAKARIAGLPRARGDFVLFVNDDTIPDPDLVRAHLSAHAELGPAPVSVLGSFRQPAEHLDNALMHLLDRSTLLFGYPAFEPGSAIAGRHYYTCNASTPRAAIEAVGGFDPDFWHYGCEDTDLGLRLEDHGLPLVYRPECGALHRHFLRPADMRRRQPLVAFAHVKLILKHPRVLEEVPPWAGLEKADLARKVERMRAALPLAERALENLSQLDRGALVAAGESEAGLLAELDALLEELFSRLSGAWWQQGFLRGFEELGLDGFASLAAPRALQTTP
jgi:glycosyltransferase involved in cell wall biosynthesis